MQHGSGLHAMADKTVRVKISVQDDSDLNQLKCSLTTPTQTHSHAIHGGDSIPFLQPANIGHWDTEKIIDISGRQTTETFKFDVPESVSGVWDIMVAVLDATGNITYKNDIIIVQNDSIPFIMPVATTPNPDANGIVQIHPSENLLLEGNILDGDYLQFVNVSMTGPIGVVWQQTWSEDNIWAFDLSQIVIPTPELAGTYTLSIVATDRGGWTNQASGKINVFY